MMNKTTQFVNLTLILSILLPASITKAFSGGGSGTQGDPYIITNVYQLQEMNKDLDAWYELGNDIDASDTANWNGGEGFLPIGDSTNKFIGHLDGKGRSVTGLCINRASNYIGLFGCVGTGGEIKDLGLTNVNVDAGAGYRVGGLVGENYQGIITNCSANGTVRGGGDYMGEIGGLVGYNLGGSITNCYADCTVTGGGNSYNLGGLVGENMADSTITNCHTNCYVEGYMMVGGLVGSNN